MPSIDSGVSEYNPRRYELQPQLRFIAILPKRTISASPGSAPSTKKGPVRGFGGRAFTVPFSSRPLASSVLVATTSPGLILASTECARENVLW